MPKDMGGDSKENTAWMENCVSRVMDKNKMDKSRAVAVCKSTFMKMHDSKSEESAMAESLRLESFELQYFIKGTPGKTYNQLLGEYSAYLARKEFNLG